MTQIPKTQTIQLRNRTRSHGKNVPIDSPDPCGRALVWLQSGRVIVRFDFKSTTQSIPNVNNPRILLSSLHQHMLTLFRKRLEVFDGILIRTVLTPHHRVDAHLSEIGHATKDLLNLLKFIRRQSHFLGLFQSSWRSRGVHGEIFVKPVKLS